MNNAQKFDNQPENFPVDSKKISKMMSYCFDTYFTSGNDVVKEFSKLNLSEKKEFGQRMSKLHASSWSRDTHGLRCLLKRRIDLIEIYRCVINAMEEDDKLHPQSLNPVNSKDHPLNNLLWCLFDPDNQTMQFQRQILILLIEYYERNEKFLGLGQFTMYIDVIRRAMEFGGEDAVVYVLSRYGNSLKKNNLCQGLLKNVCDSQFTKPRAIMKLLELDAKLASDYRPSLKIKFDESFSDELNTFDKSSSDESNMPEFVKLLNDSKIEIPVTAEYFTNEDGIKKKGLFIQSAFKDCDGLVWQALEQAMIKSARDKRDNHDSQHVRYRRTFNRFNQIVLDNIKMVFDINPNHKLSNPEQFEYIAFISIYKQHPLIYTLLEHGLKLDQAISSDPWLTTHPEDGKAFYCTQGNTLADVVAFYSSDLKLLKKLSTINSKNKFGRTPSHYAVLAVLALEDARIDRWVTQFRRQYVSESIFYRKEIYPEGMEELTVKKVKLLNQKQPTYYYYYHLFDLDEIVACFMPKYSQLAFENSNWLAHVSTPDLIGFTPIDYAYLITDKDKRDQIFTMYHQFFINFLTPILLLPSVLIEHIWEYLGVYPRSKEDTDYLVILGAESLAQNANLFTHQFQNFLLEPIKPFLDENNQFILNNDNFHAMLGIARTVLQIFNYVTFAGTVSQFESILVEPTDSKAHLTEQQLIPGFSFASNQVSVFPPSSPSSPKNITDKRNETRKPLGDNQLT